jgi:hypothetical protein
VNGTFSEPVSFFTATSMESSIGKKGNATQTSVVWGKSEGPVDASATHVLAYLLHYMSYERCAEHNKKNAGILRLALEIPGSRSMVQVAGTKMPVGVDNRVSAAWWAWRREPDEGDYICALAPYVRASARPDLLPAYPNPPPPTPHPPPPPPHSYEQCPENDQTRAVGAELAKLKGFCRGSFHGFYRIKPLAPNVCKVTFVFRGDMGGQIPKFAEAFFTKRVLGIVTKIQDRYERNAREVRAPLARARRAQKRATRRGPTPTTGRAWGRARQQPPSLVRAERAGRASDAPTASFSCASRAGGRSGRRANSLFLSLVRAERAGGAGDAPTLLLLRNNLLLLRSLRSRSLFRSRALARSRGATNELLLLRSFRPPPPPPPSHLPALPPPLTLTSRAGRRRAQEDVHAPPPVQRAHE